MDRARRLSAYPLLVVGVSFGLPACGPGGDRGAPRAIDGASNAAVDRGEAGLARSDAEADASSAVDDGSRAHAADAASSTGVFAIDGAGAALGEASAGETADGSPGAGGADGRAEASGSNDGSTSPAAGSSDSAADSGGGRGGAASIQSGVTWYDDQGNPVNAHGGGVLREGSTFYFYGETFAGGTNDFKAFSMYASDDLVTWKFRNKILTTQPSGPLGPSRVGERPHILKCASSGEYVLFAHATDLTYQVDKEVVYATSSTVDGIYTFRGILTDAAGTQINHSDIGAFDDGGVGYVITESGYAYRLAPDCHRWVSVTHAIAVDGKESPTMFAIGPTYYWLWSNKTGWRSNDNGYATAPAIAGTWNNQGLLAPIGQNTWDSQCTHVLPVTGTAGTVYVYMGDRWNGSDNSKATYVWQPLVVTGSALSMPVFYPAWSIDVAAGTWAR